MTQVTTILLHKKPTVRSQLYLVKIANFSKLSVNKPMRSYTKIKELNSINGACEYISKVHTLALKGNLLGGGVKLQSQFEWGQNTNLEHNQSYFLTSQGE